MVFFFVVWEVWDYCFLGEVVVVVFLLFLSCGGCWFGISGFRFLYFFLVVWGCFVYGLVVVILGGFGRILDEDKRDKVWGGSYN